MSNNHCIAGSSSESDLVGPFPLLGRPRLWRGDDVLLGLDGGGGGLRMGLFPLPEMRLMLWQDSMIQFFLLKQCLIPSRTLNDHSNF